MKPLYCRAHTHTYTHIHTHTLTHAHICTPTHTCTHMHTHTPLTSRVADRFGSSLTSRSICAASSLSMESSDDTKGSKRRAMSAIGTPCSHTGVGCGPITFFNQKKKATFAQLCNSKAIQIAHSLKTCMFFCARACVRARVCACGFATERAVARETTLITPTRARSFSLSLSLSLSPQQEQEGLQKT